MNVQSPDRKHGHRKSGVAADLGLKPKAMTTIFWYIIVVFQHILMIVL